MITNLNIATCSICGKNFGNNEVPFSFISENALIKELEKTHWIYNNLFHWVICPDCNNHLEIIEPEIIWKGEKMKISHFIVKKI